VDAWRPWQERRNPLRPLTVEERRAIETELEKKSAPTLRAFGADMLVTFMLSSASPPST
jgi:hypothetical protein